MTFNSRKIWIGVLVLVALIALGIVANARVGGRLSPNGREALREHLEDLSGGDVSYDVVSVEQVIKSEGEGADLGNFTYTGSANAVSGCPDIAAGEIVWCVVTNREIQDSNGTGYSHFLVRQLSGYWSVNELTSQEDGVFEFVGCGNWNQ